MNKIQYENGAEDRHWGFEGIPRTPVAGIKELRWLGSDTHEKFLENKPKGWTEESVSYVFNSYGYRSIEFINPKKFTIACYGCSHTLGTGTPVENTWPSLFCGRFKQETGIDAQVLNFGWGGVSLDFVCRTIHSTLPVIKPNLVLILVPPLTRVEMYNEVGMNRSFYPRNPNEEIQYFYEHIYNPHFSKNNLLKNLIFIENMTEFYRSAFVFSTGLWNKEVFQKLLKKNKHYAGHVERVKNDFARDMEHSSFHTFSSVANTLLKKYKELY